MIKMIRGRETPELLRLLCRNCNKEWTQERPARHVVRYEKDNNFMLHMETGRRKNFKCPDCSAKTKIARLATTVISRMR